MSAKVIRNSQIIDFIEREGGSLTEAAARFGISIPRVHSIVSRYARLEQFTIKLPGHVISKLTAEASRRGTQPQMVARLLLLHIVQDRLIDAVIDGEVTA